MMYLRLEKDRILFYLLLTFVLLLTASCGFKSKDPVDIYNKKFLHKYEKTIAKKRDKHKQIAAENNIFYGYRKGPDDDLESIRLRDEINRKFIEQYYRQVEIDEATKDIEVSYLKDNHDVYVKKVIVDRPSVTKYAYFDKKDYNNKNFNYIYYSTAQTNFDYISKLRDVRKKNYNSNLENNADNNKANKSSSSKSGKFNASGLKNKFKNLFNRNK